MTTSGNPDTYAANAQFWTKIIREGLDRYRTELTDRAVLGAIGPVADLAVLDGGCGEGYLSRLISAQGAKVYGVDTSAALIAAADQKNHGSSATVDYRVASLEELPFPDDAFDVVVCNHVISDVANPEAALTEISRVTKTGGRAVFLMLHPCFYTAHAERDRTGSLPVDVYFSTRQIDQKFKVADIESPDEVHMNFRPLEYYTSILTESGFAITHLSEPHPSATQLQEDWWRENFVKPLFLLLVGERR